MEAFSPGSSASRSLSFSSRMRVRSSSADRSYSSASSMSVMGPPPFLSLSDRTGRRIRQPEGEVPEPTQSDGP